MNPHYVRSKTQNAPLQLFKTSTSKAHSDYKLSNYLKQKHDFWLAGLPAHVGLELPQELPTFIAVGGGKGGVGKSILSANVAAKLGQAGHNVLLVDLDLGGANLHTYFGLNPTSDTLVDYMLNHTTSFPNVIKQTPAAGTYLAMGGKDETWSENSDISSGAFSGLWEELLFAHDRHNFDYVILDLGAGSHKHTIDFFSMAHLGIITSLPEPTSIENAYTFLKALIWRLVENSGMRTNSCAEADEIKNALFNPNHPIGKGSHVKKFKELYKLYPNLVNQIFMALHGRKIGFVINQIRSQHDISIGQSMASITKDFFGLDTKPLGYLNYDDAAWKSLRNKRLLVLDFPHSILTRRISEVANNILLELGY